MLALLANYWSSALFHDLTLLPPQEMMLFLFAGLTVNLTPGRRGWNGAGDGKRRGIVLASSAIRSPRYDPTWGVR